MEQLHAALAEAVALCEEKALAVDTIVCDFIGFAYQYRTAHSEF
jgi:hypothetical protein